MAELTGRVALVTGAARGQGREHCLALARAGADVAALDICRDLPVPRYGLATKDQLDEVVAGVEDLDRRALPLIADVRDEGAVEQAVHAVTETFGRLDILVNNAAVSTSAPFWQLDEAAWDAVLDTDLKGPWLVARHVAPPLMASPAARIVNIASAAGQRAIADFAHYVAEEQGLTPADVHRLWLGNQLFAEVLQPAEVSRALLWLVDDQARHVTGASVPVDGGILTG